MKLKLPFADAKKLETNKIQSNLNVASNLACSVGTNENNHSNTKKEKY